MSTGLSPLHTLLIIAFAAVTVVLAVLALVRVARLGEGLTLRVVFWVVITLIVPVIGALAVLSAVPRAKATSEQD
ncbi:hypothetical protein [Microbacterium sp. LWO13-1.2]|uniref:hypothetical protein n=1 Tax=Microbacterium sp. LWO13-1.2 TaxID=3135262 RepID=UPI00313A059C